MTNSNPQPASTKTNNPNWKEENTHLLILTHASKNAYGVLAPIAYNLEQLHGFITAAESTSSPLILQFFPWALTFASGLLIRSAYLAASRSTVPISIHLDHCQSPSLVKLAADMGCFDSIMVDMSHYEKEENLRRTRELVAYCNERGIVTEAEPGRIEGGEDGVVGTEDLEGMMTTREEVDEFVDTGVDALAPAFGNVHGEYGSKGPELDFDRLASIRTQLNSRAHLVLHGTNGFPPDLMKRCIQAGVSKINVNKLVLEDYYKHLSENVGKKPHTVLMEEGVECVRKTTEEWMRICGCVGMAGKVREEV